MLKLFRSSEGVKSSLKGAPGWAQSVKQPNLDFGLGPGLRAVRSSLPQTPC